MPDFVVLISADFEWQALLEIFHPSELMNSPLGDYFYHQLGNHSLLFYNSGWGKTRSAAATQLVIERWTPGLIINIGTCGGLDGFAEVGEILLITKTFIYDLIERMADYQEALDYYSAELETDWIGPNLPCNTRRSTIASADQDIDFKNHKLLSETFKVPAADWESAPIAWVARKNETPCLILRGVSDIVKATSSESDNNLSLWQDRTRAIMQKIIADLPFYLEKFTSLNQKAG